jgi:hypothetical protein
MGLAQETLHSVRVKRQFTKVIKLYLPKSYDRVRWLYLRLKLFHLGFNLSFVNWVMRCVTSVSF